MSFTFEIKGLKPILRRMSKFPNELQRGTRKTMDATLLVLQEKTGKLGYPPEPLGSSYKRTGTLGRTLGMKGGETEIYEIKQQGQGQYTQGRFGTNLGYARYVIGENEQAWMHKGRWWTMGILARKARPKIDQLWHEMGENLARFLEGKR